MSVIGGTLFLTNEDGTMHLATSQKIVRIKPPIRRNGKAMISPNISMVVLSTPPSDSVLVSVSVVASLFTVVVSSGNMDADLNEGES